jgi:deoxyribodipyrimidine photo-lyase
LINEKLDIGADLERILEKEFAGLHPGGGRSSIQGGQSAADQAPVELNIAGYAKNRSQVLSYR